MNMYEHSDTINSPPRKRREASLLGKLTEPPQQVFESPCFRGLYFLLAVGGFLLILLLTGTVIGVGQENVLAVQIGGVLVSAVDVFLYTGLLLVFALLVVNLLRMWVCTGLMLVRARTRATNGKGKSSPPDHAPPLTVIVPAYNEEFVILKTVQSLLASQYPAPVRVIVVDDGSTDRTAELVRGAFKGHKLVDVLQKPNDGKWSALNLGIHNARTEIVVCIDADTQLAPDALQLMCRHFADPRVGAVAGHPKVGNRVNLITNLQGYEYVTLHSFERQALEGLNAITCVAGAAGAYRKHLLQNLGGFLPDTVAEDTDMTLRLLRSGVRIVYEEDAIAWTEAPQTAGDFMRQRFRWMYGTMQSAYKHRSALFRPHFKSFGMIAMPSLLFQVWAGTLLVPLFHLTMVLLFFLGPLQWFLPNANGLLPWMQLSLPRCWGILAVVGEGYGMVFAALTVFVGGSTFFVGALSLRLDRRERFRSLLWLVPMQLVYPVLLGMTAYRCIARMLSGRALQWGRLKRTGCVHQPAAAFSSENNRAFNNGDSDEWR